MSDDDFMIGASGGIDDRSVENPEDPEFEPFGEHKLPIVVFRGLEKPTIVVSRSGGIDLDEIPVVGFLARTLVARLIDPKNRSIEEPRISAVAVSLDRFLKKHPHPKPYVDPACEAREKNRDYFSGAKFCMWCRDRLAISETLLAASAVRAVPGRRD